MEVGLKYYIVFMVIAFAILPANSANLVMLEQAGCEWCERWNEEVGVIYHKTEEGKLAPLRRIDIHEKFPSDLQNLKAGRFTPTFILLDDGHEVGRIRGYPGEDFFWGLLGQMVKKIPKASNSDG